MKGTIIEFKKEVIEVDKPWYTRIVRRQLVRDDMLASPFIGEGRQEFEVIQLSYLDENHQRVTENYFVNYEDLKIAMPIVEGMVQAKTKELNRQLRDLQVNYAKLIDKSGQLQRDLNQMRRFWFNRLWHWILFKLRTI